ncbi:hypothetical protein [Thalassospira sp. MCCC 1A01428]|jgi:hypothetical protein|uniref:hypothetical protein n=1 Tax=Thalassospira sp. MCCC 1A01428 TaxID=1470575 RepID=UPI00111BE6D4|nr:hypothetical protein [Thalassospira sp. MCCC 1A01428]
MREQVNSGTTPPQKPGDEWKIIKFMLTHLMYGGVGSVVFSVLALYFDIGGIWTLANASRDTLVFIFLLFFGLFITFGGISMGAGVMLLGGFSDNDDYDDERRHHRNDDGAN